MPNRLNPKCRFSLERSWLSRSRRVSNFSLTFCAKNTPKKLRVFVTIAAITVVYECRKALNSNVLLEVLTPDYGDQAAGKKRMTSPKSSNHLLEKDWE